MAELHLFGQVVGGNGFDLDCKLSCRWKLIFGGSWKAIEGLTEGFSQLDNPQSGDIAYWSHPVDVHFLTSGVGGWPKIEVEVWKQDKYGRGSLCSYGCLHVPSEPGNHVVHCITWKPLGSFVDQLFSLFTGGSLRLQDNSFICDPTERARLQTSPSGQVIFNLNIILRNFEKFGIETII